MCLQVLTEKCKQERALLPSYNSNRPESVPGNDTLQTHTTDHCPDIKNEGAVYIQCRIVAKICY